MLNEKEKFPKAIRRDSYSNTPFSYIFPCKLKQSIANKKIPTEIENEC